MFRYLLCITLIAALLLPAASGLAAETVNPALSALNEAKAKLEQGEAMEAYKATYLAMFHLWNQIPFSLATAVLTRGPNEGYGLFYPRKDNVYQQGQNIYAYIEPLGQRIKRTKNGLFTFFVSMDVALMKPDGTILWGKENFKEWKFTSRRPNREFFINLRLRLSNVPDGDYLLSLRARDRFSGRIAGRQFKVVFNKGPESKPAKP